MMRSVDVHHFLMQDFSTLENQTKYVVFIVTQQWTIGIALTTHLKDMNVQTLTASDNVRLT